MNLFWFAGVYGQPVNKPVEIRKWEENSKLFKLLYKSYPRLKTDRMLHDLSLIALTYSKPAVQQKSTFNPNPKGENIAPLVFQHDNDGDLLDLMLELRVLVTMPAAEARAFTTPGASSSTTPIAFKTGADDDF